MLAELGKRLGYAYAFRYANAAEIFREHAALSGYRNNGARLFDIGRLAHLTDDDYDALTPVQWPQPLTSPPVERFFAHGDFATPNGKACFVPVKTPRQARRDVSFPFTLNTGRLRDQWHTMTRTGFVPALMASAGAANYAISPIDAERLKIGQGDLLRLTTRHGSAILPAHIAAAQRPGEIFAAMHWTNAHNNAGNISRLIGPERDPHSGQPGMKHEPVAVEALPTLWHGVLQARVCPTPVGQFFSARVPLAEGMHRLTLAGWKTLPPALDISDWGARLCGADADDERIEMSDPGRGIYRLGIVRAGRLIACLFIAPERAKLPQHAALSALFATKDLNRLAILRASTATEAPQSRIVCVCHNVTETTIRGLIKTESLTSVAAIGAACKAGTNCGSCKGELAEFLSQHQPELVS
jgi:assimilatory nitrate reductase catalytic subunit